MVRRPKRDVMRYLLIALAALLIAGPALAHDGDDPGIPPWQQASAWPDRVIVTFADDPARSIAVSWRTDATVAATRAELARATPDARFDIGATSVTAKTEALDLAEVPGAKAVLKVAE